MHTRARPWVGELEGVDLAGYRETMRREGLPLPNISEEEEPPTMGEDQPPPTTEDMDPEDDITEGILPQSSTSVAISPNGGASGMGSGGSSRDCRGGYRGGQQAPPTR